MIRQAILNSVGDNNTFLPGTVSPAVISAVATSARSGDREVRSDVRQDPASHTLTFSNLLEEEELFLNKLKKLERFNFEPDFKVNGLRVSGVKVSIKRIFCPLKIFLSVRDRPGGGQRPPVRQAEETVLEGDS